MGDATCDLARLIQSARHLVLGAVQTAPRVRAQKSGQVARDFSHLPQLTAQTWAFAHGVAPCTQRYKRIGNLKLGKVRKA